MEGKKYIENVKRGQQINNLFNVFFSISFCINAQWPYHWFNWHRATHQWDLVAGYRNNILFYLQCVYAIRTNIHICYIHLRPSKYWNFYDKLNITDIGSPKCHASRFLLEKYSLLLASMRVVQTVLLFKCCHRTKFEYIVQIAFKRWGYE